MPHAGRPALRRSSRSARACGAASALSPKRSRAVLPCGTIMGASTCPMLSSRNLPSWASRVRLPSCGLPRGMAARSALFAPSRRTCSGCGPSTPSRNSVRRCSSFGRATTRPGSSNGTGSRHPPPCARASFHPRHGPRSMQSGVSQTAGGTALNGLPSGFSYALRRFRADPDHVANALGGLPGGLDPLALLARYVLGLLALFPRRRPSLVSFGALGFFDFGLGTFDLLDDGFGFLVIKRLQHRWQELLALVAHMLLEGFSQLSYLAGERLALPGGALQFGQGLPGLLVVVERVRHKVLRPLVLSQDRKEMLLLQPHLQLQLLLELREEALACFDGIAGGLDELGEELVRLGRAGLDQLSDRGHSGL